MLWNGTLSISCSVSYLFESNPSCMSCLPSTFHLYLIIEELAGGGLKQLVTFLSLFHLPFSVSLCPSFIHHLPKISHSTSHSSPHYVYLACNLCLVFERDIVQYTNQLPAIQFFFPISPTCPTISVK
jgi:hypothetical protein